jgi:general secretion pathway protein I
MKGFTLLEVLIALAIMSGVIITLIASFNYHMGIVIRDKEETRAVLLARGLMDDPSSNYASEANGDFSPQFPDITWAKITEPTSSPLVREEILTVKWNGGKRSLTLERYVANNV